MSDFKFYRQSDQMACGPTCIRMLAKHYGKSISLADSIQLSGTTKQGSNLQGISEAAEKIGFRTLCVKVHYQSLLEDVPLPCIAHWNQNHFVVIYKIRKNKIFIADPSHGLINYTKEEFSKSWVSDGKDEGILLLFDPSPKFYQDIIEQELESNDKESKKQSFSFLYNYLKPHYKSVFQLILGLLAGSLLQLIFPFLTQSIIDIGIQNKDVHFIYLILLAQMMVFFGRTTIEIIRNYILMHISTRINISLVSDFFVKMMKLPIRYFDTKMTGDIMQRINDNHRIENFLTGSSLNTLFSAFNFIIFSIILVWYSIKIFLVFLIGTSFYFLWITFFLKRRADLDFKRFKQASQNQSQVIELINGMQEIKLHNAELEKRWQWENLQVKLFKVNLQGLSLSTAQNSGASLINELKNIIITFIAAKLVLNGEVTLGMMLSISYITGQLNAPVIEMVNFVQHFQDAKLSLERLGEIHNREDEEPMHHETNIELQSASLNIKNLSFKYDGAGNDLVLKNLFLEIPVNKITAIVGSSGSGKTTLMKLLLRFYEASEGTISLNDLNINKLSFKDWRNRCGVVMQEGYIFNDTIANNIAIGNTNHINTERLKHSAKMANIKGFIDDLPLGYNTKIGMEGIGISTGQKQRILIARAIYKNPEYLFFDEATSALDAINEKTIMNNLNEVFKGKTVVVIAHRLSTVKNADQIVVLEKGKIIEVGNHLSLTELKGSYYELVKNQLELGN